MCICLNGLRLPFSWTAFLKYRYEEAKQLENDIMNAVENKNFDVAKELYIEAREEFDNQLSSCFVKR